MALSFAKSSRRGVVVRTRAGSSSELRGGERVGHLGDGGGDVGLELEALEIRDDLRGRRVPGPTLARSAGRGGADEADDLVRVDDELACARRFREAADADVADAPLLVCRPVELAPRPL